MGTRSRRILRLLEFLAVPLVGGLIGGMCTIPAVRTWYPHLVQPSFTPPGWVFAPVWTVLYVLMGLAAFLVWQRGVGRATALALIAYAVQLSLNFVWPPVFFSLHSIAGGLAVIGLLWAAVAATVVLFARVSTAAGLLLLPYLLWVSFAAALNFRIWQLNG